MRGRVWSILRYYIRIFLERLQTSQDGQSLAGIKKAYLQNSMQMHYHCENMIGLELV